MNTPTPVPRSLQASATAFLTLASAHRTAERNFRAGPSPQALSDAADNLLSNIERSLLDVPKHFATEPLPSDPQTVSDLENAVDEISRLAGELATELNRPEIDTHRVSELIRELRESLDLQEKQVKATLSPPKGNLDRPAPIESAPTEKRRAITAAALTPIVGSAVAQASSHVDVGDAAEYQRTFARALITRAEAEIRAITPVFDGRGMRLR